jgi:predicted TIM-barrel fold metal-dependent hydrolase
MSAQQQLILDAHVHVWPRAHRRAARVWHRPHTVAQLVETLGANGVAAAAQITPSPEQWDNRYGLEAHVRQPQRVPWVFGRFDAQAPRAAERLRAWLGNPGAVGVRLTCFGRDAPAPGRLLSLEEFWRACEQLALPVAVFAPDDLVELVRVLERHPRLRLIVDHLGLGVYPGCGDPFRGLEALPRLAEFEGVRIKVSGLVEVSAERYPFADVRDRLAAALEMFGARRLIWGSNHPVVLQHCSYAESLEFVRSCEFLQAEDLRWILAGTLQELLGRPPALGVA